MESRASIRHLTPSRGRRPVGEPHPKRKPQPQPHPLSPPSSITSATATYLQAAAAEYSGAATSNPLDQAVLRKGTGTSADSGLTAAVSAGDLVFGGLVASNGPGTLTPGTSQGVTFVARGQSSSGTQAEEDILSSAAGQQHAGYTFPTSVPWIMGCAAFKPA